MLKIVNLADTIKYLEEGVEVVQAHTVDYVGTGVTVTDGGNGKATVTITAGGGAHALGGSAHSADTWADVKGKISDITNVTAAELEYVNGVTSAIQTQLDGKAATTRKLDDFGAPDDNTDLDATGAAHGLMPKADKSKLDGIEASADVTDATNVDAAGAVMEADFNAQTVLAATTDDTPAALTLAEQRVLGRITSGNVAALTGANLWTILTGQAGATVSMNDQILSALKGVLMTAESELTISTGAITVTQSRHKVDTEGDAASDDLATINGGTTVNLIILRAENDARTVVVKHNTGNIWLQGKADISLDDLDDGILLAWDSTNSKWFDIAAGGGGGGGADTALSNLASVAINTTLVSDTDNTDDLGTDAVRWKDLFLSGKIECLGGMWDDDQDTGIQVEESADEDKIHMDVAGTEAFLLSGAGILSLSQQPYVHVDSSTIQPTRAADWTMVYLDTIDTDRRSEFAVNKKTGTADATETNKLHDADGGFASSDVGAYIWNTTDDTYAQVSAFVDSGELTLASDIMANGKNYILYEPTFTATEAGIYLATLAVRLTSAAANMRASSSVFKNGAIYSSQEHSVISGHYPNLLTITPVEMAANDTMTFFAWTGSADNTYVAQEDTMVEIIKIA